MPRPDDVLIGQRLRDARERAGFSQKQVAAALDIPRSAVSLIESGERSLASAELARLAQIFSFAIDELLFGGEGGLSEEEAGGQPDAPVLQYFRTTADAEVSGSRWLRDAARGWRQYAEIEAKVFGAQRWDLPVYPEPAGLAYEQGERLAQQERRRLGLGQAPVRSMVDLLEGEGVKVLLMPFGKDAAHVSGCYFFSHELGPCVVINQADLPSRRRFTEAHEYCHFLIDRGQIEGEICTHGRHREPFELRANAFSAAFLMPAQGVAEALTDDDVQPGEVGPEDVIHLMYRFGVSYEAILWRLLNLHWISKAQRARLAKVSSTALARQLGYDLDPGEVEPKPDRHRRLAVEAWRGGALSARELAEILGMDPTQVRRLLQGRDPAAKRRARRLVAEPDWL